MAFLGRAGRITIALGLLLALVGCAAGGPESAQAVQGGLLSHFLLGFWHGLIAPVMLLAEFGHKLWPHTFPWMVRMYEVRQHFIAYDLGFLAGVGGGPVIVVGRLR